MTYTLKFSIDDNEKEETIIELECQADTMTELYEILRKVMEDK